jgi:hypothetical protein
MHGLLLLTNSNLQAVKPLITPLTVTETSNGAAFQQHCKRGVLE